MVMFFLYHYYGNTRGNRVIRGGESMSVGSDGTSKKSSLHTIYTYVLFGWSEISDYNLLYGISLF